MLDLTKIQSLILPTPLDRAVDPTVPPAPLTKTEELLSILVTKMDILLEDQRKLLVPQPLKGPTVMVFSNQAVNAVSDYPIDCRGYNAVHVSVLVSGTAPSATITILGGQESGSIYLPISDANSIQAGITGNTSFDVSVGAAWCRAQLSGISGTFAAGTGYTVYITPFVGIDSGGTAISGVTAGRLTKAGTMGEVVTCTAANTDYAAAGAMLAGTTLLAVYLDNDGVVAVGAATSATNGLGVGAGTTLIPVTVTGVTADDTVHVQSSTAGAKARLTYLPS